MVSEMSVDLVSRRAALANASEHIDAFACIGSVLQKGCEMLYTLQQLSVFCFILFQIKSPALRVCKLTQHAQSCPEIPD